MTINNKKRYMNLYYFCTMLPTIIIRRKDCGLSNIKIL